MTHRSRHKAPLITMNGLAHGLIIAALSMVTALALTSCMLTVGGKSVDDVFTDLPARYLGEGGVRRRDGKIDRLIKQGADVNATGYGGTSILMWGMECHSKSGVEALLKHHADLDYSIGGKRWHVRDAGWPSY